MITKPWREAKADGIAQMADACWMEDEIDGLRTEAVGLECELSAWRKAYPHLQYIASTGKLTSDSDVLEQISKREYFGWQLRK